LEKKYNDVIKSAKTTAVRKLSKGWQAELFSLLDSKAIAWIL
jgi:hypothetical protein